MKTSNQSVVNPYFQFIYNQKQFTPNSVIYLLSSVVNNEIKFSTASFSIENAKKLSDFFTAILADKTPAKLDLPTISGGTLMLSSTSTTFTVSSVYQTDKLSYTFNRVDYQNMVFALFASGSWFYNANEMPAESAKLFNKYKSLGLFKEASFAQ